MGLFSRLKTVISAHINALLNKAEKPEKMLNQLLIDMNEQLIESKKSVAQAIADEKKLEREVLSQKNQAEEWERKAMLAVQAGKDDLAKEALLRKQDFDNAHAEYYKQWAAQKDSVEKLKSSLKELQIKIDDAQRKKNLLIARAKRAEAQQKIHDTMSGLSSNKGSFDTFNRMAKKVDELEANAEASKEMSDFSADSDLEKQFAQLEKTDASSDKMLLELKQKMGALPRPGQAEEPPKLT
ncbi:MAG: PspA/IM30 family protein [Spirochaetaceae bacterium]|jgi:phage shock protein A|nr:PspA/IM30 family protein [Spirochaetaceae bacterium]